MQPPQAQVSESALRERGVREQSAGSAMWNAARSLRGWPASVFLNPFCKLLGRKCTPRWESLVQINTNALIDSWDDPEQAGASHAMQAAKPKHDDALRFPSDASAREGTQDQQQGNYKLGL